MWQLVQMATQGRRKLYVGSISAIDASHPHARQEAEREEVKWSHGLRFKALALELVTGSGHNPRGGRWPEAAFSKRSSRCSIYKSLWLDQTLLAMLGSDLPALG